ncbi:MAG: DUF2189 domain-containing protein [Pseudomonadota bacterium]
MSAEQSSEQQQVDPDERPFVVPCADLTWRSPLHWLRLGWHDFQKAQGLSLAFGIAILIVSVIVSVMAWQLGSFALLAALLSGFVFFAPLLAVGLYSVARAHEAGRTPELADAWRLIKRVVGQAGVLALVLMVILMIWSRAGMVLHALMPIETGEIAVLAQFLFVGSAIGAVFASLTFAIAVFSLPMIADRDVDMITACISSINAVLRNKWVTSIWAALIVALTIVGFATFYLGLIVIMPWLAYSAWHSYRETLDASDWPKLP